VEKKLTNEEVLALVLRAIPYPDQVTEVDTRKKGQVRFDWRGTRYRVSENLNVESVHDGMLRGCDTSLLLGVLFEQERSRSEEEDEDETEEEKERRRLVLRRLGFLVEAAEVPPGTERETVPLDLVDLWVTFGELCLMDEDTPVRRFRAKARRIEELGEVCADVSPVVRLMARRG